MGSQKNVKDKLKNKKNGSNKPKKKESDSVPAEKKLLDEISGYVGDALPQRIGKDRFMNVALTTLRKNSELMKANRKSLYGAMLKTAQLGLQPDMLGQAYFVPFWNSDKNEKEVQLIIGYRGMLELARRSGQIASQKAKIIYENDDYEIDCSRAKEVQYHSPWWKEGADNPGDVVAVYFLAEFENGGAHTEMMAKQELDEHFERYVKGSLQMDKEDWYKKTVIRQAFKYLPVSTEVVDASTADQRTHKFDEEAEVVTTGNIEFDDSDNSDDFPPEKDEDDTHDDIDYDDYSTEELLELPYDEDYSLAQTICDRLDIEDRRRSHEELLGDINMVLEARKKEAEETEGDSGQRTIA